jgi:hypothetical protein
MKTWKFGAMVLSMAAIAACGSSESTNGTTTGNNGGSASTGSGGNGGAGGAGTSMVTSGGTESTTATGMSTGTDTTTSTGAAMTTGTGMATSTGTGMSTSTGSSTSSGGGTCAAATDCTLCKAQDKTCVECCGKANPAAQTKFIGFVIANCICAAASPCFTQCGGTANTMPPVCVDPNTQPTQACAQCVAGQSMNACNVKASQACVADPVCKVLASCQQSCAG